MKKIYNFLLLLCMLMAAGVNAQTNLANYAFTSSTGTYSEISGGTVLFTSSYDDDVSAAIPLGGTFTYGGVAFTQCYISSNGFITFTAAPSTTTYTPLSTLASANSAISAFGQDAGASTVAGATPQISYLNVGDEFVVQYKDHAVYQNRAAERMNIQIRLNLVTGAINFVYGNCTMGGTSTTGTTPQVGIRGNTTTWATNVNNLRIGNVPAGTTCNWTNVVTGNANTSTSLYSSVTNANVNIPNGLTFTWTPAAVPPVRTFTAATAIGETTATINWTAPAGVTQFNVQYRTPGSCTWTNFTGNPVTGTSATITGLTALTSYQARVQSINGTTSIWSHIPNAAGTGDGYTATGSFTTLAMATDLQAQQLQTPAVIASGCYGPATTVTIRIRNAGSAVLDFGTNNATISASVSGTNPVTFTPVVINTGTLAVGATQDVVVSTTYDMSAQGNYTFDATAVLATPDGNTSNNAITPTVRTNTAPTPVPWTEGFTTTTTPAGWNTTGWTIGADHGVSGNGIYKNLYSSAPSGQFTTQKLGTIAAGQELKFDYRLLNYNLTYPGTQVPPTGNWGNFKVQVSGDCGATFTDLETIDNTNHTVTTQAWTTKSYPLTAYVGQNILVRIVATWVAGDYYLDLDNFSIDLPPVFFVSGTSGDWNNPATWTGARVPDCNDNVVIDNGHIVTVTTAANVSKSLNVRATGTLNVTAGEVTVGCTANNASFVNNGSLSVSAGILRVNGSIVSNSGSTFNQSGGDIIIDGNNAGAAATSVAAGIPLLNLYPSSLTSVNLTGGTITFVDPHAATTATSVLEASGATVGPLNVTPAHTFRFGNGVSTDPGGNAVGFGSNLWVSSTGLPIGNMVVEGPAGTNRHVSSTYQLIVLKNITVNSGGEVRTGNIYAGGNLTANAGGIITTTNTSTIPTILMANVNYSATVADNLTIADATDPQSIGGAGIFRNAATSPTASTRNLNVQNASATGVTLTAPITVGSTFTLTKGLVNTTSANLLTVGVSGTTIGTITRVDGMVNGPLKKWYAAGTGTATLPLGTATLYKPATINFTTAPSAAGTLTASFSATAPNFPNAAPLTEGSLIINKASTQGSWFVEAGDGLTGGNYTATFTGNGATDVLDYTRTVLIKRPTAGGDWTLDGTHVTSTGSNTAPVVSRTGMGGFSEFAIGGEASVVLPITIEYFRGTKQNSRNVLDWKVSCYNSPSVTLILQRSSDGSQFKDISTSTESATRCLQPFNYNDISPLAGINYYRLKSIDVDRKISYSNVVALLNKDKGFEIVSLAPNPVRDEAILSVTSAERAVMEIVVSDLNGKQVVKQRVSLIAGNNQLPLNLRNVAAGTYQVTGLTADGLSRTLRFVKQ